MPLCGAAPRLAITPLSTVGSVASWQPAKSAPVHHRDSHATNYCVVFVGGRTPI